MKLRINFRKVTSFTITFLKYKFFYYVILQELM
jgi:hypothetical protein